MSFKSDISTKPRQPQAAVQEPVSAAPEVTVAVPRADTEIRSFLKQAVWFVLIGIVLYLGLYAVSEYLVHQNTVRNRFYLVKTAPYQTYDHVILGASHAAVFDYADMNAQLEEMTGARILNLSTLGGGITVNRLLLDYFLARHETGNVVYFLDSFAFYSPEWNEERVKGVELYQRAPFDPVLARLLFQRAETRPVALGYLLGFYKINDPDRFTTDISEEEANRFDRTYRPIAQIDRQRMAYLYPEEIDADVFQRYLADFEEMIRQLKARDVNVIVVKPPIPERVYAMLPQEAQFDAAVQAILQRHDVAFHDFSLVNNDQAFFFNTDHLNRTGVLNFYENHLVDVLAVP